MRRLSVALALLPLLALGCRLPPYNEDLSLAQMSAPDMRLVTTVGPFPYWPGSFEGKQVYFHPSKDALRERLLSATPELFPLRGFAAVVGEYSVRLVFIDYDDLEQRYFTGPERDLYLDTSDPERFAYTAQSVQDGAAGLPEHFGSAIFPPEGGGMYFDFDEFFSEAPADLNAAGPAIGASFFPVAGPSDSLHVLCRPDADTFREEGRNVTGGGLGSAILIRSGLLPGLPDQIQSAYYHHNPDLLLARRSYLSWYDPARREYRNFWWDDTLQLRVMSHLQKRIDLVLSNGWLFSRGENLGYVYDADGRFLNQFALGGLDLVGELYVLGVPRAVFTMEAWAPAAKDENPKLHFLVYTIPTERLADL